MLIGLQTFFFINQTPFKISVESGTDGAFYHTAEQSVGILCLAGYILRVGTGLACSSKTICCFFIG